MLAESLTALASLAGNTVITAASTDGWEPARHGFARLLGRGDPDRTRFTGEAGDLARARDQLAVLLPVLEQVLGPEHPYVLAAHNNLTEWTRATNPDRELTPYGHRQSLGAPLLPAIRCDHIQAITGTSTDAGL